MYHVDAPSKLDCRCIYENSEYLKPIHHLFIVDILGAKVNTANTYAKYTIDLNDGLGSQSPKFFIRGTVIELGSINGRGILLLKVEDNTGSIPVRFDVMEKSKFFHSYQRKLINTRKVLKRFKKIIKLHTKYLNRIKRRGKVNCKTNVIKFPAKKLVRGLLRSLLMYRKFYTQCLNQIYNIKEPKINEKVTVLGHMYEWNKGVIINAESIYRTKPREDPHYTDIKFLQIVLREKQERSEYKAFLMSVEDVDSDITLANTSDTEPLQEIPEEYKVEKMPSLHLNECNDKEINNYSDDEIICSDEDVDSTITLNPSGNVEGDLSLFVREFTSYINRESSAAYKRNGGTSEERQYEDNFSTSKNVEKEEVIKELVLNPTVTDDCDKDINVLNSSIEKLDISINQSEKKCTKDEKKFCTNVDTLTFNISAIDISDPDIIDTSAAIKLMKMKSTNVCEDNKLQTNI